MATACAFARTFEHECSPRHASIFMNLAMDQTHCKAVFAIALAFVRPMMTGRAGSLPDLVRLCMQPVPEHLHSGIGSCSVRCLATARSFSAQPAPAYSSDPWPEEQEAAARDARHSGDPGERS